MSIPPDVNGHLGYVASSVTVVTRVLMHGRLLFEEGL